VAKHRSLIADLRISHVQMVNHWFPEAAFMVSKWWTGKPPSSHAKIAPQSNIYSKSNRAKFLQFFGELSPMQ
jgi:hypothetical protein